MSSVGSLALALHGGYLMTAYFLFDKHLLIDFLLHVSSY